MKIPYKPIEYIEVDEEGVKAVCTAFLKYYIEEKFVPPEDLFRSDWLIEDFITYLQHRESKS